MYKDAGALDKLKGIGGKVKSGIGTYKDVMLGKGIKEKATAYKNIKANAISQLPAYKQEQLKNAPKHVVDNIMNSLPKHKLQRLQGEEKALKGMKSRTLKYRALTGAGVAGAAGAGAYALDKKSEFKEMIYGEAFEKLAACGGGSESL